MKNRKTVRQAVWSRAVTLATLTLMATGASAAPTYDYSAAIVTSNNNCLVPGSDRGIYVMKCSQGGARYSIVNGQVKTSDGLCFDHGVVKGTNPSNNAARHIKLVPCQTGNKSQIWYFMTSGSNMNMAQNAANTDVCMNIEGERDQPGVRLLVWPCNFGRPKASEMMYLGGRLSSFQLGLVPTNTRNTLNNSGGSAIYPSGMRLVAAGGGNLVAAGGGNMVAAGGGNMVAAGGGNLVAAGGGNLVAPLVGNDGASLRASGVQFRN